MKLNIIHHVIKADLLERTRRFSFIAMCAVVMFLSFFSVPNIEAPFVSICIEPNIFNQGSNASWIPVAIALCVGLLFPMIGLGFIKNNISMDRNNGFLYIMQSMNMKKANYVIGKFISNLFLLTIMWLLAVISAAIMLPFQFPNQALNFYDFISPFLGIYPGIIFVSAFAIVLESISFIGSRFGNTIGITILFIMFLINYSTSDSNNALLRIFDYSNYGWIMESINNEIIPLIGRSVQETGILVPGGMFAGSTGVKELIFHGLSWNSQYFIEKIILIVFSIFLVLLSIYILEVNEPKMKMVFRNSQKKDRYTHHNYSNHFIYECKMIFKGLPIIWCILVGCLWIYSLFAPLKHVQGYLWVLMLIFSASILSKIGCREHEHNLTEYFITIKFSLVKQMIYSYLWGVAIIYVLTLPAIVKVLISQNYLYVFSYTIFSLFIPALACFLGEFSRSSRAFGTIFLLLCFLLINIPSILFQGYVMILMMISTFILLFIALMKRIRL